MKVQELMNETRSEKKTKGRSEKEVFIHFMVAHEKAVMGIISACMYLHTLTLLKDDLDNDMIKEYRKNLYLTWKDVIVRNIDDFIQQDADKDIVAVKVPKDEPPVTVN